MRPNRSSNTAVGAIQLTPLEMVNIAAQLVEIELELRALLEDVQLGTINKDDCSARLAVLIQRQNEIAKSLNSND